MIVISRLPKWRIIVKDKILYTSYAIDMLGSVVPVHTEIANYCKANDDIEDEYANRNYVRDSF